MNRKKLIIITIFSMYYSFLYMNVFLFLIYIFSSLLLIFIEKNYLYKTIKKYFDSVYFLFAFLIAFSMPFIIVNNFSTPIYFLLTLWSVLLALIFYKNIEYTYIAIKYLVYIFILYTLTYLVLTFGKYPLGYQLEYMINDKVSANGATSFLNIIMGVYTSLSFKIKKEHTLYSSLFNLLIAIEGYGRGSIIFALILIFINIIFILKKNKIIYSILFFSFLIIFFIFSTSYLHDVYLHTKLATGLESPRFLIFKEYINKIDLFSLFFGASYENTIIANVYNNNPHITYIRTHHIFGLFYLLGLVLLIIYNIILLIRKSNYINFLNFLIIINILIRTITEPLLFPTLFDSLFLLLIFLPKIKINMIRVG